MNFKLLRGDGSLINSKFAVHLSDTWIEFTISSSGGSPGSVTNPQYAECSSSLLSRLGNLGGRLIGIIVNSGPLVSESITNRLVMLDDYQYPILLQKVQDFTKLRSEIGSCSSRVLSKSVDGGNPRRKLTLLVVLSGHSKLTLQKISHLVGAQHIPE